MKLSKEEKELLKASSGRKKSELYLISICGCPVFYFSLNKN